MLALLVPQTMLSHDDLLLCDTISHGYLHSARQSFRSLQKTNRELHAGFVCQLRKVQLLTQHDAYLPSIRCSDSNSSNTFSTRQECANPFIPIRRLPRLKVALPMHYSRLGATRTPQFNGFLSKPSSWILCLQRSGGTEAKE